MRALILEMEPDEASEIFGPEREDLLSEKPTLAIPIMRFNSSENLRPESFLVWAKIPKGNTRIKM
jgi:hypothetical protein